jgi:hypothetical protein
MTVALFLWKKLLLSEVGWSCPFTLPKLSPRETPEDAIEGLKYITQGLGCFREDTTHLLVFPVSPFLREENRSGLDLAVLPSNT